MFGIGRQSPDLDIYRSAKLLIDQHGEDAPIFAAQQADRCFEAKESPARWRGKCWNVSFMS